MSLTEKKTRLLCEDDVIKAVDKHTNDDGSLDDDISCILEEVKDYRDKIACENDSKLPRTNCNIVKPPANNGDRICNTCNKEDVCMYKGELAQAAKEITQISERVNVFIDTDIRCKKWDGNIYPLCPNVNGDSVPKCMVLKDNKYCTGNVNKCTF